MTDVTTGLAELADIPADWVHQEKSIHPGDDLRLPGAHLKWYDIRAADVPATPEISEQARQYLLAEAEAGRLDLKGDLGYAMLHVDGGYYLIVGLWRKDELWTGIFFRDTDGFKPYVIKPGAFRPTQNVVELDTTAHERRAWARFLRSARDEAAKRVYLADYCTGIVGVP
jgi:hypothetical protein